MKLHIMQKISHLKDRRIILRIIPQFVPSESTSEVDSSVLDFFLGENHVRKLEDFRFCRLEQAFVSSRDECYKLQLLPS